MHYRQGENQGQNHVSRATTAPTRGPKEVEFGLGKTLADQEKDGHAFLSAF